MSPKLIYTLAAVIALSVSFSAGYRCADKSAQIKALELKTAAERDYSALLQKKIEADRESRQAADAAEVRYLEAVKKLETENEKTRADLRRARLAGVRQCPAPDRSSVPGAGDSADLVCYDRADLLRRIEATMDLARRADDLAIRHSELVRSLKRKQ